MKRYGKLKKKVKRGTSLLLSAVLTLMTFFSYLPPMQAKAAEEYGSKVTLTTAHGDIGKDHKLYCIDKGGLAIWGIADDGDVYENHKPSETKVPLSKKEQEYVFWGILTLQASLGIKESADAVRKIRANAQAQGLDPITNPVTEEDLKALIYSSSVKEKYPWLETVASHTEEYLKLAGLIGGKGSGSTQSGKKVPDVIANSTSPTAAYSISRSDFTIHFDVGGADADFIQKVPILFSNDNGATYNAAPTDNWTYTKTSTSITFSNPNPMPPKALIKFDPKGAEYATTAGTYTSEENLFNTCMQIWECVTCSGNHGGGTPPSSPTNEHQRMVWLDIVRPAQEFYAALAGDPTAAPAGGEITFQVFRHEEDFISTYNTQLYKYDYETGKPLESARFVLYERFDDKAEVDTVKDGPVHIYKGGEPYASYHTDNPVIWNGFRKVGSVVTDAAGHAAQTVEHGYHYDKTFCDGHPAPVFVPVPEPEIEEEEETETFADDDEGGGSLNAEEIEAAKAANRALAQSWLDCVADCEEQASGDFDGVHFHWLMNDVDQGTIEGIAGSGGDEGSTPDGGNTSEPDADTAYEESGCYQDMQDTYDKFISLKYSYAYTEYQAREGYIRHDVHADDLPVEIITTDSSENGANAVFAGEYSKKTELEAGAEHSAALFKVREAEPAPDAPEPAAAFKMTQLEKGLFQKSAAAVCRTVPYIPSDNGIAFLKAEEVEEESENRQKGESGVTEEKKATASELPEPEPTPEIVSKSSILVRASAPDFVFIDEDGYQSGDDREIQTRTASPSNVSYKIRRASPSEIASPSDASFQWLRSAFSFRSPRAEVDGGDGEALGEALFTPAYEEALEAASVGADADAGPDDNYSHCNDADGERDAWRIYDHRTEGEFHINKRDMDLAAGETGEYSAYGDAQGDAALEGAVYGLFAASEITHPDGKTGVVYRAGNLIAVASTDKNGDASFLANTEAPGCTYDYKTGAITETKDGWVERAPKNLYVEDRSYDDYTEDGQYERSYQNYEADNGNCWIGRPILMGDYYVKELSRSEGYELSVGNKLNDNTNQGQDADVSAPEAADGYASVSQPLYADEQTSDDGTGAGPNELFFTTRSRDTKDQKYDVVLSNLPEGVRFFRKDTGSRRTEVQVGTGTYEKVLLTNPDGTAKYIKAENDYQYPKYNADGSPMMKEAPINYVAGQVRQVAVRTLSEASVQDILNRADGAMTEEENLAMLAEPFTPGDLAFVKGKTEAALRRNGKQTPRSVNGGKYDYSSIYVGVFDAGVRKGDPDRYGLSGVAPGDPAAYTVYGSPVQKIVIDKQKPDKTALTVGDAILSVLGYYDGSPYYSYGGIDAVEEKDGAYIFTVYAGVSGNPDNFMVLGSDPESDSIIYHAVKYIPEDAAMPPRLLYAAYSNNPDYGAFGTYENYQEAANGSSVVCSAVLITDAAADADGNLTSRMVKENIYYQTGELVRDADGNLMQAFEYREITRTETQEIEDVRWREVSAVRQENGSYVMTVDAAYTDEFGVSHTNADTDEEISFKAVLKEKSVTLTDEEAASLGTGFIGGRPMDSSSYYIHVKQAKAKAYLDYLNMNLTGDNTYIILTSLTYPGQETVFQDGGTRTGAAQVFERVIRQKVKIVKDIETTPEGAYAHNTNAQSGHEDGFINGPGGIKNSASKLDNFRFKIYLKSNLERLYRNEAGEITWLNRDGKEVDVSAYKTAYPEKEPFGSVQKFYTKVLHKTDSKTAGSVNNNVSEEAVIANSALYSYGDDGLIQADENAGYTRLLETATRTVEDGAGKTRKVDGYNYEKFFDAIKTANHDKWDRNENGSTSFKPFSIIRSLIFGTGGGEKAYPAAHNNGRIENKANTSDAAKENALRSDAVRQFAITWYLDDEVKKLVQENGAGETEAAGGGESYQEEIYDKALQAAITKAENYLKPFFTCDLDEIYAVKWDGEAAGGSDRDQTTLSADTFYQTAGNGQETSKDGYCYGVSKYLPYGAYVAVEQQPENASLGDFYNKHYKTDKPKEIVLPSVYEPGGNAGAPEVMNQFYSYNSADTPEELQRKYQIRFNEEWGGTSTDDLRHYVIRAHNNDGDYEIYKYGLDADKLTGQITYDGGAYSYAGFTVAQEEADPYKDVYKTENEESSYRPNRKVEQYYLYASLSEQAGTADNVKTMTGALTAFDGRYAAALVPWTVTEPADAGTYDAAAFTGYADGKYRNTFYTAKLRIEKSDSETGENILHDGAVFALYSASRDDGKNTDGRVRFYEKDTVIAGSREFLEAMGAENITPLARPSLPWQIPYTGRFYGTVGAGTPICEEDEQIIMTDNLGEKTGTFRAFTTTRDGAMQEENGGGTMFADQNTGYLTTPQPLGAGVYVLAEIKAPAGYVRSKPTAIEIYSDQVAYYLDGSQDSRVAAAIYEEDVAGIYINNTPIRLEVTKAKPDETEAVYELNGRLEGSITELKSRYGLENLELAYNASGKYAGYGWRKGFLDSLKKKQKAGERIEILYEDGVFTGKAKLTKKLSTAEDANRYLPGAVMTLYDAVEIYENGDSEDFRFDGVNVERDRYGNVKNIYVQKGYAGTKLKYVLDKTDPAGTGEEDYKEYSYDDQEDDKGAGTWTAKSVERENTDILFYDLGNLDVFEMEKGILYGHDGKGGKIQVKDGEPAFALKNGSPFLEIICSHYEALHYSSKDHLFDKVPAGTVFFHLDKNGNRDSRIDPYTGMAYVTDEASGKIYVWPVKISKDQYGNTIAREKITTGRIASIEADTEKEYTIGTYDSAAGLFKKSVNPVLNEHGRPEYYQKSGEVYKKGSPVYDRDGDYVRYRYDDKLKQYNDNAYTVKENERLKDLGADPESAADDLLLYRRQGEAYLIENTWTTGDSTPNDPFTGYLTAGQVDVLKRVAAGDYIMEELKAPEGYVKTMPVGLTVRDGTEVQTAKATDRSISGYFEKMDAPSAYQLKVLDKDMVLPESRKEIEKKGGYTYQNIAGAGLALYRAKRVAADDLEAHPSGYYLVKAEDTPAVWDVLDSDNRKIPFTARWTTGDAPKYLEGIPQGDYILEETDVPDGYIRSSMEIEIKETDKLQHFILPNDHTKVEIFKYEERDGKKAALSNEHAAELALYEAVYDENGVIFENGAPKYDAAGEIARWTTDDCRQYTEGKESFVSAYEKMFQEYQTGFDAFTWKDGEQEIKAERIQMETTDKNESIRQMWKLSSGKQVLVQATKNLLPAGKYGYEFDYQFNYEKLSGNTVSYDTAEGIHRFDYLSLNGTGKDGRKKGYYVLVETKTPAGYGAAKPKAIVAEETEDIQLYALENTPKHLYINKVSEDKKQLSGASFALYRAAGDGSLIMDAAHLFDKWTSGEDGSYTMEDFEAGRIPDGFVEGELKPHRISPIPYGIYYLAELSAPAGYVKMEPRKIEVTADSNPHIEAVNVLKKGVLKLEKRAAGISDEKLSGAVFEVINQDTKERFVLVTDENGRAESGPVASGKTGEKGEWVPYRYEVREIMPPETYQLNLSRYEFTFEENAEQAELTYSLSVPDAPTVISITKSDFNTGLFVKGAVLSVYAAKAENGKYEPDGAALETWVTDGNRHLIRGKLIAGHVYLLEEEKAPAGYTRSGPMIFTLSDDGRRIVNVTDNRNIVKFKTSDSYIDAVESVTVLGRQAASVKLRLTDLDAGTVITVPGWQSRPLSAADGLIDGHLYEQKEITEYTDGNSRVSGRTVFRMHLGEEGTYLPEAAESAQTRLRIETESGDVIEEWEVENQNNSGYAHTVYNPEYEDGCGIRVFSENGKNGSAVMPGSVVRYEISWRNTAKTEKNIRITASPDARTEYMPAASTAGGRESSGAVTWNIIKAAPGEAGTLILTAAVKKEAAGKIETAVKIDGAAYSCMNPIAQKGGLTLVNRVSGTAAARLEAEAFTYRFRFKDADGEPFYGYCDYTGSRSGRIKSGDSITLSSGEFITITGQPYGTFYEVEETDAPEAESVHLRTEGQTGPEGVSAVYAYKKNDSSVREIFKKGETYHLIETTVYSGREAAISSKLSFTLDETGSVNGLDMKDEPSRVVITKTDITGEKELPGAHLRIKDSGGTVVEEWISSGAPHEVAALLKPGQEYTLEEAIPPAGYAYAESITFTVSEDGVADQIRMADKVTQAVISKTDKARMKRLPGARLEIRTLDGIVVKRWTSGKEPCRVLGKLVAGETYVLAETSPPPGYAKAQPVTFRISADGTADEVLMEDSPTKVLIEKHGFSDDEKTDLGLIGGAHIRIRDRKGDVVYEFYSRTGETEEITGILTAGETYTAEETEAPDGFKRTEPVSFTVPEDETPISVVLKNVRMTDSPPGKNKTEIPKLTIKKYDKATFDALSGAEFAMYNADGSFRERIRTGEDGKAVISRPPAGTYSLVEVKAPPGYQLSPEKYSLTVSSSGIIEGDTAIPNEKIPVTEGVITAFYKADMTASGRAIVRSGRRPLTPKMGDDAGSLKMTVIIFLLSLFGILILLERRRGEGGRHKR